MAGFIELLRSGAWVTAARVRLIALILLAVSAAAAGFLLGLPQLAGDVRRGGIGGNRRAAWPGVTCA